MACKEDDKHEKCRRVCVPVDGSEDSHRAFEFYLKNVMKKTDVAIIITAQELLTSTCGQPPYAGLAFYEEFTHMIERSDDAARDLLRYYGKILEHQHLKYKLIKEVGRPGDIICINTKEEKVNLIVMGCRGLTTTKRTFLGSVSDYVVHNAHISIIVVPPPLGKEGNPRNELEHIKKASCVPHHGSKDKIMNSDQQSGPSEHQDDHEKDTQLKKKEHEIVTDV